MAPSVGDDVHWFAEQGLYDGLFLMKDEETGSFWDHMTGRAVYGPLVGETLAVSSSLVQTTVEQALQSDPDALITISDQAIRSDENMKVRGARGLIAGMRGRLNRMFQSTVDREDTRRPTMDLGLGLWTDGEARYYPLDVVRDEGRALIDTFASHRVLIYLDPKSFVLSAIRAPGDDPEWDGDILRLSDGSYIRDGILHEASGARAEAVRPLQVFTRWYGFSLTFPSTEIYGNSR